MNTINHEIQLNLSTSEVKRVNIKQNSNESHILSIRLYDNNGEYAISDDVEIYISMLKNDKTHVINSNNISLQNNAILVTMTKQMLASAGTAKCELILQKENKVLFSNTFFIYVEQNVQDGTFIESSNEYDSIVTTLNDVKEKKKVVDEITSNVSDTYNNLKDSIKQANDMIASNEVIKENENVRQGNEQTRIANETLRESTFDSLKASLESEIASVGDINIAPIENGSDSYQVKITSKEGVSSTSPNLLNKLTVGNVETGDFDEPPSVSINGNFGEQKINFRLPTGKPFKISKVYSSIGEMNSDIDNISSYSFVMIHTGSVEDEDTGKLYMKDMEDFMFITDLSGVQGIQGVKGEKGDTGNVPSLSIGNVTSGQSANVTMTGTNDSPVLNFVLPTNADVITPKKVSLIGTNYGIEIGTSTSGGSSGVRIGDLSGGNGSYTYITNDCVAQHNLKVDGGLNVNGTLTLKNKITSAITMCRTSNYTISSTVETPIPLDTLRENSDTDTFNPSNGYLIIKKSGYYLLSGAAVMSETGNLSNVKYLRIRNTTDNTELTSVVSRGIGTWQTFSIPPIMVHLSANATLALCYQDQAGSGTIYGNKTTTYMTVTKVQ